MSLRTRLLVGLLALAAAGLLVANAATFVALRAFLLNRVDDQLQAAVPPARQVLVEGFDPVLRRGVRRFLVLPPAGTYLERRAPDGTTVDAYAIGSSEEAVAQPVLPAALPGSGGGATARFLTVDSVDGGASVRVLAAPLPNGGTIVVAMPLDDVRETLARLVAVEVFVASVVLVGLAALAWWVVRLGLRPLDEMAATAGAIAGGDLSRRVDHEDDRTEVGRLGKALNVMLARIEEAFAERQRSEERLRRFVADASHELRTPLTSIRGYAELFRRGADQRPADLDKAMRRIEDEAARMGVLVDDLLLLARLDQGRPLEQAPVDLVAIASDAVDDARVTDPRRPVALAAPPSLVVTGDEQRLRQVVANLVGNALRHTPAGTPVEVRVRRDDGARVAVVEVADEGPGLSEEEAARVFERFYRGDPARGRSTGGAGLGLAIVAAIAAAHGGAASVDSTPGAGATFRVTLPLPAAPSQF